MIDNDMEINAMPDLASSSFSSHRHIIAYWITTALVVFELAWGGVWDILRVPQVRDLIERLGYPVYFLVILGIWKLLGAVALVIPRFPRLKEWAYAGVIFDLTGAVASLLASRLIDLGTVAYPIVMTGVAVASWALRPPSRRLGPG
jgi:DoxX-like family